LPPMEDEGCVCEVLPFSLVITHIEADSIEPLTQELLSLIFFHKGERFFSYTIEDDGALSIIAPVHPSGKVPLKNREGVSHNKRRWVAISIKCDDLCGVVKAVSVALANSGISIFYLSAFSNDFVLVAENEKEKAMEVVEEVLRNKDNSLLLSSSHLLSTSPESLAKDRKLHLLLHTKKLMCYSITKNQFIIDTHTFLKLFFAPRKSPGFLLFMETPTEISIVIDNESSCYIPFKSFAISWKIIQLCDALDCANDQPGIVAALSSAADTCQSRLMMISTFTTDYTLIQEQQLADTIALLQKKYIVLQEDA